MSRKIWDAETVVSAVQALHRQGSKVNTTYVLRNQQRLYSAGVRYFGTWKKVLEAANLSHAVPTRNTWSKEIIVAKIIELRDGQEPLHNHHIKKNHSILYTVSCQYFGSWKAAVEAAGIDYDSVRRATHRKWSRDAIVKEILRRRNEGLSVSGSIVQVEDIGLYEAAGFHFGKGGWASARQAAGLPRRDPRPGIIYDRRVVIYGLTKLYAEGHDINVAAFLGSSHMNLMTAGIRLFGSHDKALAAAGFDPEKIRKQRRWSKSKVLREIRALEKAGARLNWWTIGQTHPALCGVAVRLFGTWGQAVEAAGIDYRRHLRQWSTKTWLRHMSEREYERILQKDIRINKKKTT